MAKSKAPTPVVGADSQDTMWPEFHGDQFFEAMKNSKDYKRSVQLEAERVYNRELRIRLGPWIAERKRLRDLHEIESQDMILPFVKNSMNQKAQELLILAPWVSCQERTLNHDCNQYTPKSSKFNPSTFLPRNSLSGAFVFPANPHRTNLYGC